MSKDKYELPANSVVWELTLKCNLRCRHCASIAGRARQDELTTKEAIRLCYDLKKIGAKWVCLFGGEFFLRKDWYIIGETLRSLDIGVSASTNGFAFNGDLAKKLLSLEIDGLSISLDAGKEEIHDAIRGVKGSHVRVLETIHMIDELPFKDVTVITSISKLNIKELPNILELLLDNISSRDWMWMINIASCHKTIRLDISDMISWNDYLYIASFINDVRPKYLDKIDISGTHDLGYFSWQYDNINNFDWKGCRAGIDTLGIQSNGNVKGCLILPDEFIEGNIRKESIVDIWNDIDRFKVNRGFHEELLEGECENCLYGHICKGGCKDIAYSFTGTPYNYPFCLYRYEKNSLNKQTIK